MTAAKFKPVIFSVWGLALSSVMNIFIFMTLDDFLNVRNLESYMHIADRCAPQKIADGAENLILQAVQF
jgi:hypothetical protein